jgi:hypothetical protein
MKWLREGASTGVMRQKTLDDPQQRSAIRKEMRVQLKALRGPDLLLPLVRGS